MRNADFIARVDELLSEALALSGGARTRFVRSVARGEPRIARELEALLRHSDEIETFLSLPAFQLRDRLLAEALEQRGAQLKEEQHREGQVLGAFKLERRIARTRRSEVYLARRDDREWDQQVAIKVLTCGADSDDIVRRFLAERQILSVLNHPNIATILDGGITPDGFPFFVMEFIEGKPITDYCATNRLALDARVGICRQACKAVAFGHRHLIVHRDLKPSNILVTAKGQVKLLDFGIAKLLRPEFDPSIVPHTVDMVQPMTPRYASPEQLQGGPISSATDVYQLGLLFTEILAGSRNAKAALGITAEQGPRTRPSSLQEEKAEALPYPRRQLRGDLDWILLKALEARPEKRYDSAAALDADLSNYQASRPVSARKPTSPYLLRKFLRRRPIWSATIALTAVAGLAFVAVMSHYNSLLERERQAALDAAARAGEVKELLVSFIQAPDPYSGRGADARVSQVLLNSETLIKNELSGRPGLQMELFATLADVYQNLALHERAAEIRTEELRLRQTIEADNTFDALQARRKLSQSEMAVGNTEQAAAELAFLRTELSRDFPDRLRERAIVEQELGEFHRAYGRSSDAVAFLENAARLAAEDGDSPTLVADAQYALALTYQALRRYADMQEPIRAAQRLYAEELGPAHVKTLLARALFASYLTNIGRFEESIDAYNEVIPKLEQQLGPLHDLTLDYLNNLALSHRLSGSLERSAELNRQVLDRRLQKFGNTHRAVADSQQNLGAVLKQLQRYDEAIEALGEAARIYREVNQPGQPLTAYPHVSLAIIYSETDAPELAEQEARTALELLEGNVAEDDPALLRSQCLLGDAWTRLGKQAEGLALLEHAIDGLAAQSDRFSHHLEACREALRQARSLAANSPS